MKACWCILGGTEHCRHCNNNDWDFCNHYTYSSTNINRKTDDTLEYIDIILKDKGVINLLEKELNRAIQEGFTPSKMYTKYMESRR